jgi:hypothetical protein
MPPGSRIIDKSYHKIIFPGVNSKPLKIYIAYVGINPESKEVTLLEADLDAFTIP